MSITKRLVYLLPFSWLLIFFLAPFVLVFRISLSDLAWSIPPYYPHFDMSAGWQGLIELFGEFDFENYVFLTEDGLYLKAYLSSLQIAVTATFLTLLIGFPMAQAMANAPKSWRITLLMLVILPFWTSFLIRIYSWMGILSPEGFLNQIIMFFGFEPLTILGTNWAVYIGIIYSYLPFMILPIYATLERMDESLIEAAHDLGCSSWDAFWSIAWPLARPGVLAGCFLVLIPSVGEFIIPELLGGSNTLMIGKVLWAEFFSNKDWPVAATVAVLLLALLAVPIFLYQRAQMRGLEQ